MKEKILDGLKTKFVGVKDEILDRIAGKASKTITNEEELATYIEGVNFQQVLEAYGDSRATDATKTAVINYEKKHNIKDGKPTKATEPKPEPEPEPTTEAVPAWAQALIDSNKAMRDELDKLNGEKVTNSRKSQLDEILANAPEKLKARYQKDFERLSFKDDDDFASWLEESKGDIESITADYTAKGGIVTPPKGGGGNAPKGVDALVQARINARANEQVPSAIQG